MFPILREADSQKLDFEFYLQVFEVVLSQSRLLMTRDRSDLLERRRAALSENRSDEYAELVVELANLEEQVRNDVLCEVLEMLDISQEEFLENNAYHEKDATKSQQLMELESKVTSKVELLTRKKCIEVFEEFEKLKLELIDSNADQKGQQTKFEKALLHEAKIADKLWEKTGI